MFFFYLFMTAFTMGMLRVIWAGREVRKESTFYRIGFYVVCLMMVVLIASFFNAALDS